RARTRASKHGVNGVSQRIENCRIMFGNRRVQLPDIRRGNSHEFSKRAVKIDPDNFQVLANVRLAEAALVAVSAIQMHLRADEISGLNRRDFLAGTFYNSAKFMPKRNRRLDAP